MIYPHADAAKAWNRLPAVPRHPSPGTPRSSAFPRNVSETGLVGMKLTIIANSWADRGRARSAIENIRRGANALHGQVSIEITDGPGDGVRLAREMARHSDVIGIIGGDGTIHEVVNGLMPNPIPIFIIPAGSGNDYASLVRCPSDIESLSDILSKGVGARLDVLDFGRRYCINTAGLGFEGQVNRRSHAISRIKGPLLYLTAVFQTLSSLDCPHFRIVTADGTVVEGDKLLVSIGNGNRTGGAFHLTPDAVPDDGLIDVCVVDAMHWTRVVRLLPMSIRGTHVTKPGVRMLRVESLTIETNPAYPMHIDGELLEHAPEKLEIKVRPRVLPVLCDHHRDGGLQHPLEKLL